VCKSLEAHLPTAILILDITLDTTGAAEVAEVVCVDIIEILTREGPETYNNKQKNQDW
jgi:hypothetical protein